MKIDYTIPEEGFAKWREIFKKRFTELMSEFVPIDYDFLSETCLKIYGVVSCPIKSAEDQVSYYDDISGELK